MKKSDRQKVFDKYDGRCAYCGCELSMKEMQVDHLICQRNFEMHIRNKWNIPERLKHLTINDVNHIDNLMPSCRSCNKFKDTFHLELFRSEISEQPNRFRKYKATFRIAERYGVIQETKRPVVFYFETL